MYQPSHPWNPPSSKPDGQAHDQPPVQPAARQEEQERQQIGDADHAAPQAMQVLHPEDGLEFAQPHADVDLLVFGRLAIGLERGLPGIVGQGRQPAGDRPPFDHRQARKGQSRHPAEHDHDENHRAHGQQPTGDDPFLPRLVGVEFRSSFPPLPPRAVFRRLFRTRWGHDKTSLIDYLLIVNATSGPS